jgi:hypothetical protein
MNGIKIHTSLGGNIYLESHFQIGWEAAIYTPSDSQSYSPSNLLVPTKYFKSKSGAMNFIKRTVAKYSKIMGEIEN